MTTAIKAMNELLGDKGVTEILVDSPDQVYVERNGRLEDTEIRFADAQEVIDWANRLLTSQGWEPVGEGRLWAEGRLGEGDRLLIVIPPLVVNGPSVVIRKFWRIPVTFDQLLQWGSLSQSVLDFLRVVMQARLDVIVSGGTASGKTTLTNRMVELIPEEERLVAVERAHELRIGRIDHKRLIYLEAEAVGRGGTGDMALGELLRLASRMRPDRIIVGELIGAETLEVLRLMNTGHEGMVATIHATSPRDAPGRIEKMATMAEPSQTLPVIRAEIASALDLIIQIRRLEDGSRKIMSIVEVQDLKGDNIVLQELFTWAKTGVGEDGRFTGVFRATGAMPSFVPALKARGLSFPEDTFKT